MRIVDARRLDFDDHNLFHMAVLGLVSVSRRLDHLLDAHGSSPSGPVSMAPAAVEDDPLLCAVLGAIALRERFRLHLGSALRWTPPARNVPAGDAARTRRPRELLR